MAVHTQLTMRGVTLLILFTTLKLIGTTGTTGGFCIYKNSSEPRKGFAACYDDPVWWYVLWLTLLKNWRPREDLNLRPHA